ncbi:universal stress protein [Sphingobium nicotianae]|uniref:Universal stress protein n=1 Tax=Sphingobium nicotianae TaxID=2782607 RepID=A0A9X1DEB3_9SPHN|nr:universal stress protein [Sphingobium nicotianae]MBT2188360.1 universal stress protein [Sphingobium nicotianae]
MERIMVATDGSAGADRAVDRAAYLAHSLSAELVIVTICGDLGASDLRALSRAGEDIGGALDSAADQILADATERAHRSGAGTVRTNSAWGDPAQAIIEMARSEGATMLVVGRRGRGRLTGLVLGSVSQKLTSLAGCAVLVVP